MDSASQSVDLFLPAAHLPAHILAVDAIKGNAIKRDDTLFSYNFFEDVAPGDNELPLEANAVGTVRVKRFAEFRAPMAGIVRKISVRPGMEISSDGCVPAFAEWLWVAVALGRCFWRDITAGTGDNHLST